MTIGREFGNGRKFVPRPDSGDSEKQEENNSSGLESFFAMLREMYLKPHPLHEILNTEKDPDAEIDN